MGKILDFFRRWSLGRVKVVLFGIFTGAVAFQYVIDIKVEKMEYRISISELPTYLTIIICFFFLILISVDFWFFYQKNKDKARLLDIIEGTSVSDEIKMELIKKSERIF